MKRSFASIAAAIFFAPAAALACSCGGGSYEDSFREAAIVFEGELVAEPTTEKIDVVGTVGDGPPEKWFTQVVTTAVFAVTRPIKNVGAARQTITYDSEHDCGVNFAMGVRYRIVADKVGDGLTTSYCNRNAILSADPQESGGGPFATDWRRCKFPDEWRRDLVGNVQRRPSPDEERFIEKYLAQFDIESEPARRRLTSAAAYVDLARKAEEWRDFERVADFARRAILKNDRSVSAYLTLADGLWALGRKDDALRAAERARALSPGSIAAQNAYALLLLGARGQALDGHRDFRDAWVEPVNVDARGVKLVSADFTGARFGKADFTGADLASALFDEAWFDDAVFNGANLPGARFDGAGTPYFGNFDADFTGANLKDASFREASADDWRFDGANLRDADFTGASAVATTFKNALLDRADFSRVDFFEPDFRGAVVGRAGFRGAQVQRGRMEGVDFRAADLEGANLKGSRIDCATRLPKGLNAKALQLIPIEPQCSGAPQNRDFSGVDWRFVDFSGLDLRGAEFRNAMFDSTKFEGADLAGADLSHSSGNVTYFSGADLTEASFAGADLYAIFAGREALGRSEELPPAKLHRTDFAGASLQAGSFLGGANRNLRFDLDLSTATFANAKLSCSATEYKAMIEAADRERERLAANPPIDDEMRRIADRQRERAEQGLAAEGALVRFLAARWPTMNFDEACRSYLADGAG